MHGNVFGIINNLTEADLTPYEATDAGSAQCHTSLVLERRFNSPLIKLWG